MEVKNIKKLITIIILACIIIFAGIYGSLKKWTDASFETIGTKNSLTNSDVSDYMASMNIYRFSEPAKAPDFELISLQGETHRLNQYRGKAVLLSFLTTW